MKYQWVVPIEDKLPVGLDECGHPEKVEFANDDTDSWLSDDNA